MTDIGPKQDQLVCLAEVRDRTDAARTGSFLANIYGLDNELYRITYVSPYGSNAGGAFIAVPEVGTQILVVKPYNTNEWFYLGTTFNFEPLYKNGQVIRDSIVSPVDRCDPTMYKSRGFPTHYVFKSPTGAGISMIEDENSDYIKKYTEVKSTNNKKIRLDDTPNLDSIILDSGNGAKILLTNAPDNPINGLPAQSVQVHTTGPQKYINYDSQTDIYVGGGGKELQILNAANGVLNGTPPTYKPQLGVPPPLKPSGNVNIQSTYRDVNVFTKAPNGRIFIECLNAAGVNQQIVIETNGAGGGITIKTNGTVMVDALQGVDINTAGNINMQCAQFNLTCADMNAKAGVINLDGGIVNLAPEPPIIPVIPQVPSTAPILKHDSDYGNIGINTFDLI
jgi:hypothetical protein